MDKQPTLQYRTRDYFNKEDLYLFKGINYFVSKVEIEGEKVFTAKCKNRMQYKAETALCININELEP